LTRSYLERSLPLWSGDLGNCIHTLSIVAEVLANV
jgi:hypothetical protein